MQNFRIQILDIYLDNLRMSTMSTNETEWNAGEYERETNETKQWHMKTGFY